MEPPAQQMGGKYSQSDLLDQSRGHYYKAVVKVRFYPEGQDKQEKQDEYGVLHEDIQDCIDIWEVSKFYNDCQKPNDRSWQSVRTLQTVVLSK